MTDESKPAGDVTDEKPAGAAEGKAADGEDEKDWKAEAERWKAMSRKNESAAKANAEAARKLQEVEDAKKSEADKVADRLAAVEKRAADAELKALRAEVASDKDVPKNLRRFLTGTTQEELEEQADELLAAVAATKTESGGPEKGKPAGTPKEKLKSGATSASEPEETDPRKLAAAVRKY